MDHIYVNLLETPSVTKNGENIKFPFKKAEALFYYLLVHKKASRDTLVNLLWGEVKEEIAKKNLRQAMYKIRKTFDTNLIISPKKSMVMLNPDIKIKVDLYDFLEDENKIDRYKGFLNEFYVKDAEEFQTWVLQYEAYLKDIYIKRLDRKIEEGILNKDISSIIYYGELFMEIDPFHEKICRILMNAYVEKGEIHKAIHTYRKLRNSLKKELGIDPAHDTKELYKDILNVRKNEEKKDFFYGREKELLYMRKQYKYFKNNRNFKSFIIFGEAGIGKSRLKDEFLENVNEDDIVLHTSCYQAQIGYLLKPFYDLFMKLEDVIQNEKINIPILWTTIINHIFPDFMQKEDPIVHNIENMDTITQQVIEETLVAVLKKVSKKRKIILVFEDIQWIDDLSLLILNHLLEVKGIFLITTCRNGYEEKISLLIDKGIRSNELEEIFLNRFDLSEVKEFIKSFLPKYSLNEETCFRIYEETGGNVFFLREVLNSIKENGKITKLSTKTQDILRSRFLDIPQKEKEILKILCMFFDPVDIFILEILMKKRLEEMIDPLEKLKDRGIIKEINEGGEICFQFTHQKLREFLYDEQSSIRKKFIHIQIANILKNKLHDDKRDRYLYPKLIYHFENSGSQIESLKYKIRNLDVYFNFGHELFPILRDGNIFEEGRSYLSEEEEINQFKKIEKELSIVIKLNSYKEEIKLLHIEFLHMRGRYFIREGRYDKGIEDIKNMTKEAMSIPNVEYALKGYRQMIYYAIQIHDIYWMKKYIEEGMEIAKKWKKEKDIGILLRLKGLQKIMEGDYPEAEEILKKSIQVFEKMNTYEGKYTLNIAAGYNYMGEIRRRNLKFMSALRYYEQAVKLCTNKKIIGGLTVFYTNAGQAAFDMGDDDGAIHYFKKALKIYKQLNTLWKRSTAEGYMALLFIKKGKYQEALSFLKRADEYANQLKSPYEFGIIYRVKAEIKVRMKDNILLENVFRKYLKEDIKVYCEKGINILKPLKDPYEIYILDVLKNN